jgi:hypothetical protein
MAYSLGNACTGPVDGSVGSAEAEGLCLCQPAQALPQGFESYRCVALFEHGLARLGFWINFFVVL